MPFPIHHSADSAGPRLLVSVRSSDEAICAIEGDADILDVKEPDSGSLGMASRDVMQSVAEIIRSKGPIAGALVPLSVALGELHEWLGCGETPVVPEGASLAKLGLSRMAGKSDWQTDWQRVRAKVDLVRKSPLKWVAVAYADVVQAASPSIHEVVDAAIQTGCAGVLVDTYSKTGLSLLDFVEPGALRQFSDACHLAGMFAALAGSLNIDDLPRIKGCGADVIAIRSAACSGGVRRAGIDSARVREFRAAMSAQSDRRQPVFGRTAAKCPDC